MVFTGVSKSYKRGRETVRVLDDVDLAVAPGERVALIGPSGSGKSTLLHLAGGLADPDGGSVHVDGTPMATRSLRERADLRRRHIGFVFQFFHLLPALSVVENVALPLVLDGDRRATPRAAEMVDRVGLAPRADHLPSELSGGEMQRAAIARALIGNPQVLLADEPTGNLDRGTGQEILGILRDLNRQQKLTIVMVTHDLAIAEMADRVVRLVEGRVERA